MVTRNTVTHKLDKLNVSISDFESGAVALLLDSSFRPISFVNLKRLVSLVFRDCVEIVSHWEDEASYIPGGKLPSVLRLIRSDLGNKVFKTKERKIYSRRIIFARDGYRCQYCTAELNHKNATIDHIMPKAAGGPNSWQNCVACCRECNAKKGSKIGLEPKRTPKEPNVVHYWRSRTKNRQPFHDDWGFYL